MKRFVPSRLRQTLRPAAAVAIRSVRSVKRGVMYGPRALAKGVLRALGTRDVQRAALVAPSRLVDLRVLISPGRTTPDWSNPMFLSHKLWNGFSTSALKDLHAFVDRRQGLISEIDKAAWVLAEWYAIHGDYHRARSVYEPFLDSADTSERRALTLYLAVYCAVQTGDFVRARGYIERIRPLDGRNPNLLCAEANANAALDGNTPDIAQDDARLRLINATYPPDLIAPLRKKDPTRPLGVDNITADAAPASVGDSGLKVSIIVPVYNGEHTLGLTLDCLLAQTWANLEILVVDDCSTDGTAGVIASYVVRDARVKALRNAVNSGSYTARNLALEAATGDVVTVHDANDWSHPQKIEQQARHLEGAPDLIANTSQRARVDGNFLFQGKFRHKWKLIDWDPSSFMIRIDAARALGGWDRVRISADAEFINRVRKVHAGAVVSLPETLGPLSFAYDEPGSLTSASQTHGRTIHHGTRREYGEASRYWHSMFPEDPLRIAGAGEPRNFPVPGMILPDRQPAPDCDLLLVGDFNAGDPVVEQAVAMIGTGALAEHRVSILHWRYYALDTRQELAGDVRALVHTGKVTHLIAGQTIKAARVVVLSPAALAHSMDRAPHVETGRVDVIFGADLEAQTDHPLHTTAPALEQRLIAHFGLAGDWHALDASVQNAIGAGKVSCIESLSSILAR